MTPFVLRRVQWVPQPLDEVFAFFADAGNLEAITPDWLCFRILSPKPVAMRTGARIHYRLHWHGLPLRWLTEIRTWKPPTGFVDVQLRGPYRQWHHTHRFRPTSQGTLIHDVVRYALPLGPLGRLAHAWVVRRDLEAIFDHRAARVAALLGSAGCHA